jgi:tRNA A-37 threonylcarbamoyl transferase component Bud32
MVPQDAISAGDGDPFLGRVVAGRFVVLRRLGAGSMGTVYRARQEAVARDIALKILRSDRAIDELARQRFVREAKAMSLLASPHTVTVFDFGEMTEPAGEGDLGDAGVSLYLAMELLDGEALGERLKRLGRLPWADAMAIVREALLSLSEAHEKGVIHRDLKPDNLFLARAANGGEIVKVLDFGIAKVLTDKSPMVDALETQAGTVFGTPRYMSPEQAQGRQLDPRSDLYSLGVILYQMLVGRPPFVDDDAVVVMARHIKQKPVPPHEAAKEAQMPLGISHLVMRVLAKDPGDRPDTAEAFMAEIDAVVRAGSGPDPAASGDVTAVTHVEAPLVVGGEGPRAAADAAPPRRRVWTVALALLGAVLIAAGSSYLARGRPAAPPPPLAAVPVARPDPSLADLPAHPAPSAAPVEAPAATAPAPSTAPMLSTVPGKAATPAPSSSASPSAHPTGKLPKSKYTRFD